MSSPNIRVKAERFGALVPVLMTVRMGRCEKSAWGPTFACTWLRTYWTGSPTQFHTVVFESARSFTKPLAENLLRTKSFA